jgi:hypothetical protein
MPITASVGALSYPRSKVDSFEYWYLETDQNASFNNFLSPDKCVIVGQDTTANEALYFEISGFDSYPQILTQKNDFQGNLPPATSGIYRGVFLSTTNVYSYGSFEPSSGTYPFRAIANSELTPNPNYASAGIGTLNLSLLTMCSWEMLSSNEGWVVYRDYNRLIYRRAVLNNMNQAGPLTYVNTFRTDPEYVPQNISKLSNDDAIVSLNLYTDAKNGNPAVNLIRRVNKNYSTAVYNFYPTIWQRSYSQGAIYDQVIDNDILYFVSSQESGVLPDGNVAALDSSGTLSWSKNIPGVFLTGIAYHSNNIYVSGYIDRQGGNLYIAKYDLSGNQQWQTELSGDDFTDSKIQVVSNGVYVVGNVDTFGFAFKVPIDGSIPVNNVFTIKSKTYTYGVSALTDTTGGILTTPVTSDTSLALFGSNNINASSNVNNYTIQRKSLTA